jgi:hypothetical protein
MHATLLRLLAPNLKSIDVSIHRRLHIGDMFLPTVERALPRAAKIGKTRLGLWRLMIAGKEDG